jgi:hypothetical protein
MRLSRDHHLTRPWSQRSNERPPGQRRRIRASPSNERDESHWETGCRALDRTIKGSLIARRFSACKMDVIVVKVT